MIFGKRSKVARAFMPLLAIPLQIEVPAIQRPLPTLIIPALIAYQAGLGFFMARPPAPGPEILHWEPGSLAFAFAFAEGLVRMAGFPSISFGLSMILVLTFFLVFGRALENRGGCFRVVGAYVAGALLSFLAMREHVAMWEPGFWLGIGGVMGCIGLAYFYLYADDVKFFYVVFTPWYMGMGFSSTAAIFLLFFLHVVLALAQFSGDAPASGPQAAANLGSSLWTFLVPFLVLLPLMVWTRLRQFVRGAAPQDEGPE